MKHLVCYSGGHSSALVAIEVVRRFGKENVILLNHDIISSSEALDIKRFKKEVAAYLDIEVTYCNMMGWEKKDQFDVVIEAGAFKVGNGTALCTNRMKTQPFEDYLEDTFPEKDAVIYYGFDKNETQRIQRRSSHLGSLGFRTDYPLALWERTIQATEEIGIQRPNTYSQFKHANCVGCLKAGKQHWYIVYCTRPDIWTRAKHAEDMIEYSILRDEYLEDLEPLFQEMKDYGIEPNEHMNQSTFWSGVKKSLKSAQGMNLFQEELPCECIF